MVAMLGGAKLNSSCIARSLILILVYKWDSSMYGGLFKTLLCLQTNVEKLKFIAQLIKHKRPQESQPCIHTDGILKSFHSRFTSFATMNPLPSQNLTVWAEEVS